MQSRPFLSERPGGFGDGFQFGAFLALVLFVVVVGAWLASAAPMLGSLTSFVTGKTRMDHRATVTPMAEPLLPVTRIDKVEVVLVQPTAPAATSPTWTPAPALQPTYTPYPTYTPVPGYQDVILQAMRGLNNNGNASLEGEYTQSNIKVRLSYYWPPLGGINCDELDGHSECYWMASGLPFVEWVGTGVACPADFPLFTVIEVQGKKWKCVDRGGAIIAEADYYWIDFLYPYMPIGSWGDVVDAIAYIPAAARP